MQAITLYERVVLRRSPYLNLRLPGSLVAPNNKNTAIKAALTFFDYTGLLAGVDITIYKNTPVRAGMAGGSADAAAVLVGLNALYGAKLSMSELCALGAGIGSVALLPMAGRAIWLSSLLLGIACLSLFYIRRFKHTKKESPVYKIIPVVLTVCVVIYTFMGAVGLLSLAGIL